MLEESYYICFEVDYPVDLNPKVVIKANNKFYVTISQRWFRPRRISDELWNEINKHVQFKNAPIVSLRVISHSYGGPNGDEMGTDYYVIERFR